MPSIAARGNGQRSSDATTGSARTRPQASPRPTISTGPLATESRMRLSASSTLVLRSVRPVVPGFTVPSGGGGTADVVSYLTGDRRRNLEHRGAFHHVQQRTGGRSALCSDPLTGVDQCYAGTTLTFVS